MRMNFRGPHRTMQSRTHLQGTAPAGGRMRRALLTAPVTPAPRKGFDPDEQKQAEHPSQVSWELFRQGPNCVCGCCWNSCSCWGVWRESFPQQQIPESLLTSGAAGKSQVALLPLPGHQEYSVASLIFDFKKAKINNKKHC